MYKRFDILVIFQECFLSFLQLSTVVMTIILIQKTVQRYTFEIDFLL